MDQETNKSFILPKTGVRENERTACVSVWESGTERASCEQVFAHSQGAGLLIIMEVMVRRGIRGNFPND